MITCMSDGSVVNPNVYLELPSGLDGSEPASEGTVGIYVHFPFCRSRCSYCDFDTFAGLEDLVDPYLDAAIQQIRMSLQAGGSTLYVGGGTPSLMHPDRAGELVEACRERFCLPAEAEVTLEANPGDLGAGRLKGFRLAGFTRLSLGVQSADERLLRLLGRRHRCEDARRALDAAREAGFQNVGIDLIYGAPLQDETTWMRTLETVVEWGPEHISCYMLSLETGTPLERAVARGDVPPPSDDAAVSMYVAACRLLADAGYLRYEISNWARPGFECTHNLVYWRNRPYLGIGAGAAGCWRGRRYRILGDVRAYLEGVRHGRLPLVEDEAVDVRRSMSDTLILGLRLDEGVSREQFRARYGVMPEATFGDALEWAEGCGLLERTEDRLRLTERGILLSNELFLRLL